MKTNDHGCRVFAARVRALLWIASTLAAACGNREPDNRVAVIEAASTQVPQTPLDATTVRKYVDALPTFVGRRINGTATVTADIQEFQQKILPASFYSQLPTPFNAGTYQWGYKINNSSPSWPATTIEVRRGA